jgi:hypothetical protein
MTRFNWFITRLALALLAIVAGVLVALWSTVRGDGISEAGRVLFFTMCAAYALGPDREDMRAFVGLMTSDD